MPHMTLHGLRHSFASLASDLGFGIPTIKELIGHSPGTGVTEGYVHSLDSVLIAAADKVSGAIYNYLSGTATALSAKSMREDDLGDQDAMMWAATQGGQLVSLQEAAVMLGVGRPTVERLIEEGELVARALGKQRRLEVTDVLSYRRANPIANKPILAAKLGGAPEDIEDALLSAEEAAMVLRVGRPTVMKLIAGGQLKAERVGARFKVKVGEVIALRDTHAGRRRNIDVTVAFA
jgi:excisionase family DNA binding protein